MKTEKPCRRIAVLGHGAIGRRILGLLQSELLPSASFAVFDRPDAVAHVDAGVEGLASLDALIRWDADLAIECAGHAVVSTIVPGLLQSGTDVVLASVGALSDRPLRMRLDESARAGAAQLRTVSGAIGGLDALSAARMAGLQEVVYTGRKPPIAWRGTPAEDAIDLGRVEAEALVYEGNAAGAAAGFPQNANVTAAVALAGVGFEKTRVRLMADPTISRNVHELECTGAFGRFHIRLENNPLPDNPKTSWLAVLSIEAELRRYLGLASSA